VGIKGGLRCLECGTYQLRASISRKANEPFTLRWAAILIIRSMVRLLQVVFATILASVLLSRPVFAGQSHCEGETEAGPQVSLEQKAQTALTSWVAIEVDDPACDACAMPGCPLALCPAGAILCSPVLPVPAPDIPGAPIPGDLPEASSRTLEPPKPPPNSPSRFVAA
jgi:hypothetical protein